MMGIQAPSMSLGSNPNAPRPPRRTFRDLNRRTRSTLVAVLVSVGLIAGGTAAYASTVTNVTYATATASPVVASNVKVTSNVTTKITLHSEKVNGGSMRATCYQGSTFKSIFKAHPSAKCVVISRNGQKFMNSAISASGKRVWFNDYVGSIDSKAGTKSATWYWDVKSHSWHKGNCWNMNKLQGYKPAAHSVSYYHIVSQIKYTLTETLSSEGKVMVTATATCVQGAASASASAQAIAAGKAWLSITVYGSTKVEAQANAKAAAKALASKLAAAAKAAAISRAQSTAKGSIRLVLSAQASASASCTETTITPPPSTTPPVTTPPVTTPPVTTPPVTPPVTTPPVTTPPVTTPPVTTPPPTTTPPTPKQIQVCRLSDKQIVMINENEFNSNTYSMNLADCKVTPPPTTQPPAPQAPTISITHINQVPFGASRPDTQVIYMVPGNDKYTITVVAGDGTITAKSDDGNGTYTFTYNAPNDVQYQNGGTDTITATIKDTTTGLTAPPAVISVTIAPALPSQ
jgi:hypothetical protein